MGLEYSAVGSPRSTGSWRRSTVSVGARYGRARQLAVLREGNVGVLGGEGYFFNRRGIRHNTDLVMPAGDPYHPEGFEGAAGLRIG